MEDARSVHDERSQLVSDGYDRIAEIYERWGDPATNIKGRYIDVLRRHVTPGSSVLDLGCGTGAQVTQLLASEYGVVGVDISRRSIELARSRIVDAAFVVGDIGSIAFAEQSFDAVVAFFSLIHVPRELHGDLLSAIKSWLRPGGWLICTMSAGVG